MQQTPSTQNVEMQLAPPLHGVPFGAGVGVNVGVDVGASVPVFVGVTVTELVRVGVGTVMHPPWRGSTPHD